MMRSVIRLSLLVTGTMLLVAGSTRAQTPITGGVMAGIDFSSITHAGEVVDQIVEHSSADASSKVGAAFGGFVEFRLRNRLSFNPGLLFVMKGVKLDESDNFGTVKANVHYLEFPLLVRYATSMNAGTAYALVGPSFGVKAGTSARLDTSGSTVEENIDPAIRSFDMGLVFGGGLERGRYLLEARYTLGMTDIATAIYPHADSLQNRVLAVFLGLKFK
jgi:hypothetical protein